MQQNAETTCEVVSLPEIRFVAMRTAERLAALLLHKGCSLMDWQQTMLMHGMRCHVVKYSIVTRGRAGGVSTMLIALDGRQHELPLYALSAGHGPAAQLTALGSEDDLVVAPAITSPR